MIRNSFNAVDVFCSWILVVVDVHLFIYVM